MKIDWLKLIVICSVLCTFSALAENKKEAEDKGKYPEIEWAELIPKDDLEALLNPPSAIDSIADGSAGDSLDALEGMMAEEEAASRYYAALKSAKVVESFNGKNVKLPGFIVPLQADEENRVTEFFIVPYFGACLHLPPPPPNQIVYAKVEKGFNLNSMHDAYWFEGKVTVADTKRDLGHSAYSLDVESVYLYEW